MLFKIKSDKTTWCVGLQNDNYTIIKFNWFPFSHNYSMPSGAHFLNPFSKVFQNNSTVTKLIVSLSSVS